LKYTGKRCDWGKDVFQNYCIIKVRNILVHSKTEVEMNGSVKLPGFIKQLVNKKVIHKPNRGDFWADLICVKKFSAWTLDLLFLI